MAVLAFLIIGIETVLSLPYKTSSNEMENINSKTEPMLLERALEIARNSQHPKSDSETNSERLRQVLQRLLDVLNYIIESRRKESTKPSGQGSVIGEYLSRNNKLQINDEKRVENQEPRASNNYDKSESDLRLLLRALMKRGMHKNVQKKDIEDFLGGGYFG